MKVLFAGSRWLGVRCLEELVARRDLDVIGAYCTDRGWEGTDTAAEAERLGVRVRTKYDLATMLRNGSVDLCFSACTSHIFRPDEIAGCKLGIINLHPAPLPFYRGCNSYAHAILNGESAYGVSLHYVDEGIDSGPILARDWLPIEPSDTGRSLYERAQCVAANLFHRELDRIVHWAIQGERVPDVLAQQETQARYYCRESLEELRDATDLEGEDLDRRMRALEFPPFPPAVVA